MAETTVSANVTEAQWADRFFTEYVRDQRFKRYMGTDVNSVIQINEDLTKKPGDGITFDFLTKLSGAGVEGNAVLEGNEENLGNYGHKVNLTTHRHGVVVTDHEEQMTHIGLLNAAKPALKKWAMEHTRDKIIDALGSVAIADGGAILYADAEETTHKDAWLANNSDRVLFGAAKSNNSANDHSTSLANVDATADLLSPSMISLAKRMAKEASPTIRPITVNDEEEWYVLFANSRAFRDLKTNSTMTQANREAWTRYNGGMNGGTNPLFRDQDLVWDGVIIREIPEIGVIGAVGAGNVVVGANYLCGAQALGVAYAKRWAPARDTRDYGFRKGVAIHGMYGVEKLFFNTKQNGVLTLYASAGADA